VIDRVGQVLGGRYRLLAPVGTGASASVYLADDVTLRRRVAVKILHDALAEDEAFLRRFRAEAHAAAQMNHPHVVAIYDWGQDPATHIPYLVTEYLGGGSLRAMLDAGPPLSLAQTLLVGLETARGLEYAHRRGFVHRDIKPANLLFDEDARLRIADFGLARALAEAAWTEPMGAVLGTARYASPEQARGETLDGRSDVYSLALVMVEAATGSVPFSADTTIGILMARIHQPLPVPDDLGALAQPLRWAGDPDPTKRPDAAEFGAALMAAASSFDRPAPLQLAGARVQTGEFGDRDPTALPGSPTVTEVDEPPGDRTELDGIVVAGAAAGAGAAAASGSGTAAAADPLAADGIEIIDVPDDPAPVIDPDGTTVAGARWEGRPSGVVPAVVIDGAPGATPGTGGSGTTIFDASDHLDPDTEDVPASRRARKRQQKAAATGAVGAVATLDRSADDAPRRRRRWPFVVLLTVLVLGAAAAGGAYWYYEVRVPWFAAPELVGLPVADVAAEVAPYEWTVTTSEDFSETVPKDHVISQDPAPGTEQPRGASISVVVSRGQPFVAVPADLVGLSFSEATAKLREAGLSPGGIERRHDEDIPVEHVVALGPDTPVRIPKGSYVGLILSDGPAPRVVPGVVGSTEAEAREAIEGVGLEVVVGDPEFSETVDEGLVISASPTPGSTVERGTTVRIVVSKGPPMVEVPDVKGMSVDEAEAALEARGLVVSGTKGSTRRDVTSTDPPAGTMVKPGSKVELTTSGAGADD
jgi:serine/threonine-protein kinase